jgi:MFS family permease
MLLRTVILIVLGFQIMLNLTRPIFTLYASNLGASTFDIGILTATYAFFPLLFAIHVGKITDYVGDRLPVIWGTLGMSIGVALPFCFPFLWSLYLSQAIVGVAQIFVVISLQNVIGNAATKENRDYYFSMFSMAVAFGGVIGPVAGGYLAEYFSYSFVFLVATAAGCIPITFSFLIPNLDRTKETAEPQKGSAFQLLKLPVLRIALITSALVLYSRDIFVAYFPLYANQLNISIGTIGWIITVQSLAMMSVRLYLSK